MGFCLERKNIQILKRKLSLAPILLLLAISGGVVYAITYFTVIVPSSVTIATEGELSVTTVEGVSLGSLDFGVLAPGGSVNKTVLVTNLANRELALGIQSDLEMLLEVFNGNGSPWIPNTVIPMGGSIQVTLRITASKSTTAGTYSFTLTFVGRD